MSKPNIALVPVHRRSLLLPGERQDLLVIGSVVHERSLRVSRGVEEEDERRTRTLPVHN